MYTRVLILVIVAAVLTPTACGGNTAPASSTPSPYRTKTPTPRFGLVDPFSVTTAPPKSGQADQIVIVPNLGTSAPSGKVRPSETATPFDASAAENAFAEPVAASARQHTVKPGDTLLVLAADYGVSMAAIQLANHMGSSFDLFAGNTLRIPASNQWEGEGRFWIVHIVRAGETLIALARTYGLTVPAILRVNAIADPSLIHPDQQLVIPASKLVLAKTNQPTTLQGAADFPPSVSNAGASASALQTAVADDTSSSAGYSNPPQAPAISAPPPDLPAAAADWPSYILARINQARSENGLVPLVIVPALSQAAQAHAEDCARRGWGSHVGSDGATLQTRLARVGYSSRGRGENWVQARNAERAFGWWYGEIPPNDPHRRNILSSHYDEVGIGIAKMGAGYIFVTDFGNR